MNHGRGSCAAVPASARPQVQTMHNVLFLCTGNSARSILAECLLNTLGAGRFHAYSAGSHPAGRIHPLALELVERKGWPVASLRSKSWDEFAQPDAPRMDIIITVCDSAAGESCPVWPGHPAHAHWSTPDPAAATGSMAQQQNAFAGVFAVLRRRIELLLALPLAKLDATSLQSALQAIPRQAGESGAGSCGHGCDR